MRTLLIVLLAWLCVGFLGSANALAEEPVPPELAGVGVQEHLGSYVTRSLEFTDDQGKPVHLGDYLRDGKPMILTLNYYECPSLCNLQLNGLTDGLRALGWRVGREFRIVTVSINPRETSDLAAAKRGSYLESLAQPQADWSFLVGSEKNVAQLAREVGYGYRYDPEQKQYAHPLAIMVLAPDGMVARYLYGMEYPARDLKFALMEASQGRVGSPVDKVLLSCFHFDPVNRQYTPFAMGIMRLGGGLTVVLMLMTGWALWRKDKARRRWKEAHP